MDHATAGSRVAHRLPIARRGRHLCREPEIPRVSIEPAWGWQWEAIGIPGGVPDECYAGLPSVSPKEKPFHRLRRRLCDGRPQADFRAEFGRYFVCEAKDWAKAAGFAEFAKFCRVLDSVKAKFGILFAKSGISGRGSGDDATREQMKVFQDRGIIILVVDESDLQAVADGRNFISLLRSRYESVRLDLEA